jgi:protein Mpv17
MAPLGHHYYGALDRKVFPLMPTSPKAVLSKVAIDQLLFAPVCTVFFYAYKCFVEGRSDDFIPELKQKWVPTVMAGYKLWPAAHVINFLFVPTQQRILYANVVSVAGTYILSRAAAGDYSTISKFDDEKKKDRHHEEYEVVFDTVVDVSTKHDNDK